MPPATDRRYSRIAVDKIVPNERNPRTAPNFTAESLLGLRQSIQEMGIVIPIIVQKFEQDLYILIEGERRWTVAKSLGLKEIPAIVLAQKLSADEQVSVMSHLHEHRKGWDAADHLLALQTFMHNKPDMSRAEVAAALGMSMGTLNDRIRVLKMGAPVLNDIARGKIDATSALRAGQAATQIAERRPELAKELGGEKAIEKSLLKKASALKGGISQELTSLKPDIKDTENVSDETMKSYVTQATMTVREMRQQAPAGVAQRAAVMPLAKKALGLAQDLRDLQGQDLTEAPNLRALRDALIAVSAVAGQLAAGITDALNDGEVAPQTERITKRPRRRGPSLDTQTVKASLEESDRVRREEGGNGAYVA